MTNKPIEFILPQPFTIRTIKAFLNRSNRIFQWNNLKKENFTLNADGVLDVDLIGQLLLYKFLEYTVKHCCFLKPNITIGQALEVELKRTNFWSLINDFLRNKDVDYRELKFREMKGLFIAPINLSEKSRDEAETVYAPLVSNYYKDRTLAFVVLSCLGEIASNFHEHADDATNAIMVASGNTQSFNIACADTGKGIVSTLRSTLKGIIHNNFEILHHALGQGVTSKACSNHTGYGLWLINSYVTATRGEMHIYSEGAYLINHQGKIKQGSCSFWKGTITYIHLPLTNKSALMNMRRSHERSLIEL